LKLDLKKITLILSLICPTFCFTQDILLAKDSLLLQIYSLQSQGDAFFADGLFASERFRGDHGNFKYDNNIFFTALITYTLQSFREDFAAEGQQIIDSICSRAKSNYPRYRNRNNDITYNFWQTNPDNSFPNSKFWSKREKARLPDDFDDTSILFLTKEKNDSLDNELKELMAQYSHQSTKKKSTFKRYKDFKAYNTWFGIKMKQDFDICVMSNTLLFVFQRGLNLNEFDNETIHLIEQMVISNDYLKYPYIISPHYRNNAIILYHLSRLIANTDNEILNSLREKVIRDLYETLDHASSRMEKVILLTSLYRLDEKPNVKVDIQNISEEFKDFYFFVANPFSGSNLLFKRILVTSEFLCFRYRCEAYYWTLLLEFKILSDISKT
jgi:hypothetical protein